MHIRPTNLSDEIAIRALLDELENRASNQAIFHTNFLYYLGNTNNIFRVIEKNSNIIGFISCIGQPLLHHEGWVYEIQELVISKAFQRGGFGRALIEHVRNEVSTRGGVSLEVTTNKRRKNAHVFYQSVGFINSHEKFTYYF